MAFLTLSDETGSIDGTVFPKEYYLLNNIRKNDLVKIKGTISKRYDKISIVIDSIVGVLKQFINYLIDNEVIFIKIF